MRSFEIFQNNEVLKNNEDIQTNEQNSSQRISHFKMEEVTASHDRQALQEFFEDALTEIYWAENALVNTLLRFAQNASSEDLIHALENHATLTKLQVKRIEEVFSLIRKAATAKKSNAMASIIKESEIVIEITLEGFARDAGIIAACQKVAHYEIAAYGALVYYANILRESDAAGLLQESLHEEKDADGRLNEIARYSVNTYIAEN